ncbi:unnamed protein product [Linum trigynum]|uniref:J domain-containing protein n=1 Tax=Linum trigynum TaxID=586398 RepID=A0AAV2GR44_9ROSI
MDGNKDEALRCISIAEEAIAAGNKQRALRFIRFAQRLNRESSVDDLLAACEKLASADESKSRGSGSSNNPSRAGNWNDEGSVGGDRSYSEENLQLIRQINRTKDYYAILSVGKSCSADEIRKSYRKLSLRVHPDKNKAPGAEEAFKKVCAAFKCLSDGESRRQYDHVGLVRGFGCSSQQRQNARPRRATRRNDGYRGYNGYYDDDEMYGQYFNRNEGYRAYNPYMSRRERATEHNAEFEDHEKGASCWFILLQILPFLVIFLLAYVPFTERVYSLRPTDSYRVLRKTEKHGVEFYVRSPGFDQSFPVGSTDRSNVEGSVVKEYKLLLWRYCHMEMQRRHWNKVLPTPNCNKLHNLGLA